MLNASSVYVSEQSLFGDELLPPDLPMANP